MPWLGLQRQRSVIMKVPPLLSIGKKSPCYFSSINCQCSNTNVSELIFSKIVWEFYFYFLNLFKENQY
jgi:hypothetical protein